MPNRRNNTPNRFVTNLRSFFGIRTTEEKASSTLNLDPQIARRMTQMEGELARLAESQQAARDERIRLERTIEILRAAGAGTATSDAYEPTRTSGATTTAPALPLTQAATQSIATESRKSSHSADAETTPLDPPPVFEHAD